MHARILALLLVGSAASALAQPIALEATDVPERPEALRFDELEFEVPDGNAFRHELANGVVAYVAEDHTFPLIQVRVILRQGSYLDPPDKVGLAILTGSMMRSGGTAKMEPDVFDEEAEFLAAQMSSFGGDAQSGARLGCISTELERSLDLFFDMLRTPRFDDERFAIEKGNVLEAMRQRNDDADDVLRREWSFLLYGEEHYTSRRMTKAHLDAISRADLAEFHRKYWRPENMIFAISGDVDTESFLENLEARLSDWPGDKGSAPWPPPLPSTEPKPGVYHVEKDIPQGKVLIGHRVPQWTDWENPDRAAIQVMQHILGGSGFTSRIMQRVRSDEGLAYSAGSSFSFDPLEPGTFTISFQSKNETVALAARIALDEVERIQSEPVSQDELDVAKNALIDSFPRRFESAGQRVNIFSIDEYYERSHDYWTKWRDQIAEVDAADVQRVASQYLRPSDVIFLVVGKWDEVAPGDPDGRASMEAFFGGEVTRIPLRDPLTLE